MFAQHLPPEFVRLVALFMCVAATCLVLMVDRLFLSGRRKRASRQKPQLVVAPEEKRWWPSNAHRRRAPSAYDDSIERSLR